MNGLLERRFTLQDAVNSVKVKDVVAPFLSNVERFPFFEVIYAIMSFIPVSAYWQGIVGGWLYGTITVPVQNFRFRRKMERPIEPCLLWQAYPPTVLRDMAYGCSRCVIYSALARHLTTDSTSVVVTAFLFGVATWLACVFSSPLNEWRGYWVQPPNAKVPLGQFFKQERYVRSTLSAATIMSVSLAVGALLAPVAEAAFISVASHSRVLVFGLAVVGVAARRQRGPRSADVVAQETRPS